MAEGKGTLGDGLYNQFNDVVIFCTNKIQRFYSSYFLLSKISIMKLVFWIFGGRFLKQYVGIVNLYLHYQSPISMKISRNFRGETGTVKHTKTDHTRSNTFCNFSSVRKYYITILVPFYVQEWLRNAIHNLTFCKTQVLRAERSAPRL